MDPRDRPALEPTRLVHDRETVAAQATGALAFEALDRDQIFLAHHAARELPGAADLQAPRNSRGEVTDDAIREPAKAVVVLKGIAASRCRCVARPGSKRRFSTRQRAPGRSLSA